MVGVEGGVDDGVFAWRSSCPRLAVKPVRKYIE